MQENKAIRRLRDAFHGRAYQSAALLFCVLFGLALIANNQGAGEAWWFWYADLHHRGLKLYADLHLALQPLYVLETGAWIRLFGTKCLVTEIPSVLHVVVFCFGIFLILRESDWPDWQKAIILTGAFLICVDCVVYRFDDYHILADTLIYYSLALLLILARTEAARRQYGLAAGLGFLSGLALTTRLNDGAALLVSTGICLLVLARRKKLIAGSLFVGVAFVTVILVVKLTGDSVADYVSNSMVKAANAKGGTGKIFLAPWHLFTMATHAVRGHRWIVPWLAVIVAAGAVIQYYWKDRFRYLVPLQVATGAIVLAVSSPYHKQELLQMVSFMSLVSVLASYLILPIIIVRLVISRMRDGKAEWDPREILLLIPVAELASFSTSNAGTTVSFLSPIALLLLLVPVLQPFRRQASWLNPSFVSIVAMMGLVAAADKIDDPYTWLLFHSSPMFENRQWYRHPVYGPMYIDRDLLHFIEPICQQVDQSSPRPELLSMPFSYPNYFCDTPPWHGYVQTFFDTSTPSTIERLEKELQTSPPEWIVYQRQIKVMREQELTYHKGQPLAHRDLDTMIMRKIASGQWKLVEKSNYLLTNYLPKEKLPYQDGDGWYVIRTRP